MATQVKRGISPGKRLALGTSVLSGAKGVDTSPVKDRLGRFERVHRTYASTQRKVDAIQSALRAAQSRGARRRAAQQKALDALAGALIMEGKSKANPFESFGKPPPSVLMRPSAADAAQAVHDLVAAIQASGTVTKVAAEAAQAADKAARAVDETAVEIEKLQDGARHARRVRDAGVAAWQSAFDALRHAARAAAADGAPGLYEALFPKVVRVSVKTKTTETPVPTEPAATAA
jgi:hypothetical protein